MKYRLNLIYQGYSENFDKDLYKAASKVLGGLGLSHGSGCGFEGRDHDWYDLTKQKADRLNKILSSLPDFKKFKTSILIEEQYENF